MTELIISKLKSLMCHRSLPLSQSRSFALDKLDGFAIDIEDKTGITFGITRLTGR